MIRTQIYLTKEEQKAVKSLAHSRGMKQSAIIRQALDQFISSSSKERRTAVLDKAAGLWRNRRYLPDFNTERRSWDRS